MNSYEYTYDDDDEKLIVYEYLPRLAVNCRCTVGMRATNLHEALKEERLTAKEVFYKLEKVTRYRN